MENTIAVTLDEFRVIAALLKLYNAACQDPDHSSRCKCQLCAAIDRAGGLDHEIYLGLMAKVERAESL